MPKNLDERPGTFPRQRAIVAGDPRGADLYEVCLQDAADRTAYLKARIEHVDPDGMGVRRLRRVASFADLRALTDHPDRSIIVVGVIGLYQFFAESTLDELEPEIIKPASGGGRWLDVSRGAKDVANGVPQLNASARLPTERLEASGGGPKILATSVVNGLVYVCTIEADAETSTSSSSFVDVDGASITVDLAIGDVIKAEFYIETENMSDTNPGEIRVALVEPDGTTRSLTRGNGRHVVPFQAALVKGAGVATQAGSHTVKLQFRLASGTSPVITRLPTGSLLVARP